MDKKDYQKDGKQVRTWICSVCGYEHEGTEPPKKCPRCGVGAMYLSGKCPHGGEGSMYCESRKETVNSRIVEDVGFMK